MEAGMYLVEAKPMHPFTVLKRGLQVLVLAFLCILVFRGSGWAQDIRPQSGPLLITYGADAPTREGDPTFNQVIYIEVPDGLRERFYVRVFDPDTGGDHDLLYGRADTSTRFAVFGGEGALTEPKGAGRSTSDAELSGGVLIAERSFEQSGQFDDAWVNIAFLRADQGEKKGDRRVFRLVVEGENGNDGNLYDVALSLREGRQLDVEGARLFSYSPTVRVPNRNTVTELRFVVPDAVSSLEVHNFDAAHGKLSFTTAFRSQKLRPSGQDNWRQENVEVSGEEAGQVAAITLAGGREIPNDATFYVAGPYGTPLALEIPPFNWLPNRRPEIEVSTRFLDGCRAVSFDADQSTDPDGHSLSFLWKFEDGESQSGPTIVKSYSKRGRFSERLEVRDNSGQVGNGSASNIDVWIKALPIPDIAAPGIVAAGESVTFDASGSYSDGASISRYHWSFNDGHSSTGDRIARVFEQPGDYQFTLSVNDDSGHACDSARLSSSIRINAAPVAEAGPDRRIAVGSNLQFDASGSYDVDGSIVSYLWDMGDGTRSEGPSITHAYATPGSYKVTLQVQDDAGVRNSVATDAASIMVNAPPITELGGNQSVAVGEVVQLDGSNSRDEDGQITAYLWELGDGTLAFGESVEYAYSTPGTYTVRLTVTDDSGTTTSKTSNSITVRVNQAPTADAGDDQVVTTSSVTFDGTGSFDGDDNITSYDWDFGDGTTGEGPRPVHVYKNPGEYQVRLMVTDASGTERSSASDVMKVKVNAPPIADAGPDLTGAPGEELVFQASRSIDPDGDIYNYTWNFKDGTTGEGEVVRHAFEKPGRYFVSLKVIDETGHEKAIDFDETEVFINEQPVANAGNPIRVAPNQEFTLSAARSFDRDGEISDYRWDLTGNPDPVYAETLTLSYPEPGSYLARLTISDDSGAENSLAEDQVTIRVNHQPKSVAGRDIVTGDSLVTFDAGASLDADGDGLSYQWDFGDGTTGTGPVVAHTYSAGGIYPVVLTVDDGSGLANSEDRDSLTVTLNSAPVAVAGSDQRLCTGDILVLDGSGSFDPDGGVLKYHWDFGDGVESTIVNPTKTYRQGGTYSVALSVTDDSGLSNNRASDRIAVIVDQAPVADAGADMKVCANTEIEFDGSRSTDIDGVVNRFLWDFGDGGSSGGERPKHIFRRAGKYTARLTIEGDTAGSCDLRATDDVVVEVTAAPVARIRALEAVAVGDPVSFDGSDSYLDGGEILGWAWDFGDGELGEGKSVSHVFDKPGTYRVGLTVDSTAESSDCRQISGFHLITVNAAPTAEAGEDLVVGVNEEFLLDGSRSFDPDGALASYSWDLGNGVVKEGVGLRHRYEAPGTYDVVLKVTDTTDLNNSTALDIVRIVVNDSAPLVLQAPEAACVGEDIILSASQQGGQGDKELVYKWGFGDGTTATASSVSKKYQTPGRYNVSVLVDDGMGRTSSVRKATRSLLINTPPTAIANSDRLVCPGDPVRFSGEESFDPDRGALSFHWDLGDGNSAQNSAFEHSYDQPGTYEVTLRVTDNSNSSCSSSVEKLQVYVNAPPVVDAGEDRQVFVGGANDTEVFSAWRSYDLDGTDLDHVWTFGPDGQKRGQRVTHAFQEAGDYEVTLTANDGSELHCGTASDTVKVKVVARDGVQG